MKRWLPAMILLMVSGALGCRAPIAHANEDGPGIITSTVCDLGAFLKYMRADGSVFTNTRQCAMYAENGGTLYPLLDLRLAVGLDAQLCLPSSACAGMETKHVMIVIRNVPKTLLISGTLVNLAGFGFSPRSTVTVSYALNGAVASQKLTTAPSGFFSLTGSSHVSVPCGAGDVTFSVTDDATGLVRTVTPELWC